MTTGPADLAAFLKQRGVRRVYGIPGGGSLALLHALEGVGIEFVLTHSENAAVFMAGVEGESSPAPGVAVTALGPGAAAAANAVANCLLDRIPVVLLTDRLPDDDDRPGFHQRLDHPRLFAEVTKASLTLDPADPVTTMEQAFDVALTEPVGPVHVDVPGRGRGSAPPVPATAAKSGWLPSRFEAGDVLAAAERPLVAVGLGARNLRPGLLEEVAAEFRVPVMTTYRGKGGFDETSPWWAGVLTGGGGPGERSLLARADALVGVGLDQIELLPAARGIRLPRVSIATTEEVAGPLPEPAARHVGDLAAGVAAVAAALGPSSWVAADPADHLKSVDELFAAAPGSGPGLHPWSVATAVATVFSPDDHVVVDAGAHMFPMCQAWRSGAGRRFWISNGLSTMAYALPTAIALTRRFPDERVVCVTGDAGLLMTAGELETAARSGGRLTVVVFDDSALSLIRIKQDPAASDRGVVFRRPDWAGLARAFGLGAGEAAEPDQLVAALEEAADADRPTLLAVAVDPSPFAAMMGILRSSGNGAGTAGPSDG